jgi:hypothetical protein
MKSKLLFIPILLLLTAYAQYRPAFTSGVLNGRAWRGLSRAEKVSFLLGYTEGLKISAAALAGTSDTSVLFPETLQLGELADLLDKSYTQPGRADEPISKTIIIITAGRKSSAARYSASPRE